MLLKVMNLIVGLFGYQYITDHRPLPDDNSARADDEGWDDLYKQTPRYRLVKKQ